MSSIAVYEVNGELHVSGVPQLEGDKVRALPGAQYRLNGDLWVMPFTRAQAWGLSDAFGERLAPSLGVKHQANLWVADELNQEHYRQGYGTEDYDPRLYDYQQAGVNFLDGAGSALLGDDMGIGKTVQALVWMRQHQGRHLIVCTNSMKYKWAEEAEIWYPDTCVTVIDGTKKQKAEQFDKFVSRGGILIINYEALRLHSALAHWAGSPKRTDKQKGEKELNVYQWQTLTFDEAHKLKDPSSQTARVADYMSHSAEKILGLTGTPILNNLDDLWAIMRLIAPDEYGSRNNFRDRFCILQPDFHQGFSNVGLRAPERPAFDRLFMPRFLRRTKEEVLPELPEKMAIDYRVLPMTPKQGKAYAALKKDMMAVINEEFLAAESPLSLLTRLRQVASAVPVIEDNEVVSLTQDSNKLRAVLDILTNLGDDSLVVYADSRKLIEMFDEALQAKGYTTGLITGAIGPRIREKNVKAFQDGNSQVMLGTTGAGAEGITLTRASTLVLAQQSWSHGVNAQAIDRVHRIGQQHVVHPIVLVSKGTVDEAVREADNAKRDMLQDLVRDAERLKAVL